ncbi:hypothetical protein ALC56_11619, partial [Trachymyrmex septentrionalis]
SITRGKRTEEKPEGAGGGGVGWGIEGIRVGREWERKRNVRGNTRGGRELTRVSAGRGGTRGTRARAHARVRTCDTPTSANRIASDPYNPNIGRTPEIGPRDYSSPPERTSIGHRPALIRSSILPRILPKTSYSLRPPPSTSQNYYSSIIIRDGQE